MQIDLMVMCPRLHRERFALESNTYYVKICLYKIQFFFYFYYKNTVKNTLQVKKGNTNKLLNLSEIKKKCPVYASHAFLAIISSHTYHIFYMLYGKGIFFRIFKPTFCKGDILSSVAKFLTMRNLNRRLVESIRPTQTKPKINTRYVTYGLNASSLYLLARFIAKRFPSLRQYHQR